MEIDWNKIYNSLEKFIIMLTMPRLIEDTDDDDDIDDNDIDDDCKDINQILKEIEIDLQNYLEKVNIIPQE